MTRTQTQARRSLAIALFAVAFGTNVSTPLLLLYQDTLSLSAWMVTALFAVYPLGLAPALAFSGPASDALGRRRVVLPALVMSGVASAVFAAGATNLALLFLARFLLGAVSGVVFVVTSAWMQELADPANRMWAARLNGMVLYAGFGLGPLMAGILGQWGPSPLTTPYLVHIGIVVLGVVAFRSVPETVTPDPTKKIRPNLGVPASARSAFWRVVAPTALAVFGFPSLAFGLFPVLLRPAMADIAVFATGIMLGTATIAIFFMQGFMDRLGELRAAPLGMILGTVGTALGTIAFATDLWGWLFPSAFILGGASGLATTAGLRLVDRLAVPADRGALTGTFYAIAYVGMTMPVVVTTLAGSTRLTEVLIGVTVAGAAGSLWLARAVSSLLEPA